MGDKMVNVMDRTMDRQTSHVLGRAISEAAAARVIDDVILAMFEAGLPSEKAKGIGYAAQEFLVGGRGCRSRARTALLNADFVNGDVTTLLDVIEEALSDQIEAA